MVQIDIQMPSDCYSCWVRKNIGCKIANDSGWLNNKRDDNCPLKEQEAVEPTFRQGEDGVFVWACGSCGAYMYHIYDGIDKAKEYAKYCRQCGKKVKWE